MPDGKLDAGYISPLRSEILESQNTRMNLMKYKLLAVATLGAVGLGLGDYSAKEGGVGNLWLILGLLPFICLYIDIVCCHNNLRILVIGNFLSAHGDVYERFLGKIGDRLATCWQREQRNRNFRAVLTGIVYGEYYKKGAAYFFHLEDWALHYSTYFVSGLLATFGFFLIVFAPGSKKPSQCWLLSSDGQGCILVVAGFLGIGFTVLLRHIYLAICGRLFATVAMVRSEHGS